MQEEELVQKAKKGDAQAFGKLYDLHMPAIYRFALVKVSNKTDAEDITHQVFLKAWKHIEEYKFQGFPFTSWLYRIAQNAIIDFYRTSRTHQDIDALPEIALSSHLGLDDRVDKAVQVQLVMSAISRLDETGQNVLLMKFVNELSNKEIAEALEKSEGAIRVIQHRALKQLKQLFEHHGTDEHYRTTKDA
ncbi:MAG: hypothetical protein A3D64_03205 [Candidatus Wildermuthbacteria bacterium RIFCSPHIGHO2_02_FULL_49_9]|uniref:Uncharacterized protein n=2 Tax=Parcubacteria group TaxID=1794811 RepID=A0A1F6BWL2_9BACT|nr:MAG: hypothetical protein A3A21_04185 [Candidatus Jorgensenbacteria bacterium RIFCSPLOWO2_01_FULL_45_25b]OHA70355.1 MAG: hypothetical protein A3D64_03205 [Candidatus Wildermuthbacteria bacterium RIFCSPHIGHO2_02_FULL_49_9]